MRKDIEELCPKSFGYGGYDYWFVKSFEELYVLGIVMHTNLSS